MNTSLQPMDQLVPGANLAAYVQTVSSIPVLSADRERELALEQGRELNNRPHYVDEPQQEVVVPFRHKESEDS